MAQVKFGIQKSKWRCYESQMQQYTNSMDIAMSDGHIDNSEMAMLKQQLADTTNRTTSSTTNSSTITTTRFRGVG